MLNAATHSTIVSAQFPLAPPSGTAYGAARTLEAAQPHAQALIAGGYAAAPETVTRHSQALQAAFGSTAAVADAAMPGSGPSMTAAATSMSDLPTVYGENRLLPLARGGEATFAPRVGAADAAIRKAVDLLDHSHLAHVEAGQHLEKSLASLEPIAQKLQVLGEADTAARTTVLAELAALKEGPATAGSASRMSELATKLTALNHTNGAELLARLDHPGVIDAVTSMGTSLDMVQQATDKGYHGMRIVNNLLSTLEKGAPLTTGAVSKDVQQLLQGSRVALADVARATADSAAIATVTAARQAAEGLVGTLLRVAR